MASHFTNALATAAAEIVLLFIAALPALQKSRWQVVSFNENENSTDSLLNYKFELLRKISDKLPIQKFLL